MAATDVLRTVCSSVRRSTGVFVADVASGMLEVSHNALALLGLTVIALTAFGVSRADLRDAAEGHALAWLQARQEARAEPKQEEMPAALVEPNAMARTTAIDPADLTRQQSAVAHWIARRYRVALEPVSRLVQEAWDAGRTTGLQPTLILATMAIESSFNPFAQSPVGAQGLMQVMTQVHDDKYKLFGGRLAAFDPVTNLRVGVQVLKECIARAGSIEVGLQRYVGAGSSEVDGSYAGKVLAEQQNLNSIVAGRAVPINASTAAPAASAASAPADGEMVQPPAAAETAAHEQVATAR